MKRTTEYVTIYYPQHPRAIKRYVRRSMLVAEATIGRFLAEDEVVHHVNGDKSDDRPENLRVLKKHEHSLIHSKGSSNGNAKLSDDDVRFIRASTLTPKELTEMFGVKYPAIYRIRVGNSWKHL